MPPVSSYTARSSGCNERLIALAMPTISGLFLASGKIAALIGAIRGESLRITRVSPLSLVFSE